MLYSMRSLFKQETLLGEWTTFGIGGRARYFFEVRSIEALQEVVRFCEGEGLRYFVLGKGSNTLFDDRGFDGVVILNKIQFKEVKEGEFYVGAGYSFALLGTVTAREGWEGLEFAAGIPGSVGGAVFMNAGAGGSETCQTVVEVVWVNEKGAVEILPQEALAWDYRWSQFQKKRGAIAAVRFRLKGCPQAKERQRMLVDYRTKTQPYGEMSAGCLFRNPPGASAGRLIEACGLKGRVIGGAEVSMLHANFVVNKGSATASDVLSLAREIQQVVEEKTGHRLEMEIRRVAYS